MSLNFGAGLFPPRGEVLANFDFRDLASGTGFVEYYIAELQDSDVLSSVLIYSKGIERIEIKTGSQGTYTKIQDIDYDITFNMPQTLKGTAIVNVNHGYSIAANGGSAKSYIIATLKKWDGASETTLGTNTSDAIEDTATSDSFKNSEMVALDIDITQILFKKGETLRLTIEQWTQWNGNASQVAFAIGQDPKNRIGSTLDTDEPTIGLVQIPFRIAL
jgi:hypothetical protein